MFLRKQFEHSPIAARVAPFIVFILLTGCQGWFGESGRYWFYFAKSVVGAWLIWEMRPFVSELRLNFSWEAVAVGVGVLVMWVGIDGWYPSLNDLGRAVLNPILKLVGLESWSLKPSSVAPLWNPHEHFAQGGLAWFFVVMRIAGSSLVVPALEEVFYRSFLYRYVAKPDFQSVPLHSFLWMPFLVTAVIFGVSHHQWLAGILCGFAYQGLVIWKKRLGDAIVAHGITNSLLGLWVVWKGDWKFW